MLSELSGVTHSVNVASSMLSFIGLSLAQVTESYPLCEIGASHSFMNTVDGSPFSKNVFLNNVSKKLLTLLGSFTPVVGRYGFAVEALAVVPIILLFR